MEISSVTWANPLHFLNDSLLKTTWIVAWKLIQHVPGALCVKLFTFCVQEWKMLLTGC